MQKAPPECFPGCKVVRQIRRPSASTPDVTLDGRTSIQGVVSVVESPEVQPEGEAKEAKMIPSPLECDIEPEGYGEEVIDIPCMSFCVYSIMCLIAVLPTVVLIDTGRSWNCLKYYPMARFPTWYWSSSGVGQRRDWYYSLGSQFFVRCDDG